MKQFYAKAVYSLRGTVNAGNRAVRLPPTASYWYINDYNNLTEGDASASSVRNNRFTDWESWLKWEGSGLYA